MLHNNGRKVEVGGSLETRLSAGEEHAKKKSPIGRHDGSARDGSLEGMKCPHESYFGNQYSWLHCRPDDDTLPRYSSSTSYSHILPPTRLEAALFWGECTASLTSFFKHAAGHELSVSLDQTSHALLLGVIPSCGCRYILPSRLRCIARTRRHRCRRIATSCSHSVITTSYQTTLRR